MFFTGDALILALFPSRTFRTLERVVWCVGAGIALSILGGLVLNEAGGLTRRSWVVLWGVEILVCYLAGAVRVVVAAPPIGRPRRLAMALPRGLVAAVALSAVLAGGAIAVASWSTARYTSGPTAQLFLVRESGTTVVLGVTSDTYRKQLVVRVTGNYVGTWKFTLTPGHTWQHTFYLTETEHISASLVSASGGAVHEAVYMPARPHAVPAAGG